MTDEDRRELAEVEDQLSAKRKRLAIIGLVLVGAVLAWRVAIMVDRTSGGGDDHPAAPEVLEVEVARSGQVTVRGCDRTIEHCVAAAKVRQRNQGGGYRADLRVAPGAPEAAVAEIRALLASFELEIIAR